MKKLLTIISFTIFLFCSITYPFAYTDNLELTCLTADIAADDRDSRICKNASVRYYLNNDSVRGNKETAD